MGMAHKRKDCSRTCQNLEKMADILMFFDGVAQSTLVFMGQAFLISCQEREERNKVNKEFNEVHNAWAENRLKQIDLISHQLSLKPHLKLEFTQLDEAKQKYEDAFEHDLEPLEKELMLSDFQALDKSRLLAFLAGNLVFTSVVLYFMEMLNGEHCDGNRKRVGLYRQFITVFMHG